MQIERVILIVLDGVGVGALPDAAEFGDVGSNSLLNTARAIGGLSLPNLQRMGLGNLTTIRGVPPATRATGAYGKMAEMSKGKDTIIGHWELAGVYSPKPMPLFPHGFPSELVTEFEHRIGRKILGNKAASGTEIIQELGDEHCRTARPILYTSADSVFQVAAHEEVVPVSELYQICELAREMLVGDNAVGRVIARPFSGTSGHYRRTERRRDWSLFPPSPTVLDKLSLAGYDVIAVGKIEDIFVRRGITASAHTTNNLDSIVSTLEFLRDDFRGLLFTNLIDFDMLYGHRNDPCGYAQALAKFDVQLPVIFRSLRSHDLLIVTSDHGNDPVTPSTDHSREYVPLLVSGPSVKGGVDLGIRSTFADVAATITDLFGLDSCDIGTSFVQEVLPL
jgi:phosphopentomutase